ncbi:MAG: FAD-dependent oxidoreductase, partial [Gammaproteobacteria bacterium]
MNKKKLLLLLSVALLLVGFFAFDLGQYLSLAFFKAQQARIDAYYQAQPLRTVGIYFAIYVAVTGLSLPGAAIMTLAAGAIFDLFWGTVIVSFASTIGATLAFLASRFLLRDAVQARFGDKLKAINAGIEKDGSFYLFILRLVPAFPFFVVNLVMGLTPIRTTTFGWVSQLGMLAGTLVYVNAGTQIARIDSLAGILSPGIIASFVLLGLFPLLAKRLAEYAKARKALRRFPRPKRFDRNLVVIGAGSAGLVAAYIAAAVKARVTLIEKHKMGGDCLNTGCVPSKALLRSAKLLSHIKRAKEFGFRGAHADFDFAEIMQRVQRIVRTVEPHDSSERYTSLGVECIQGEARISSPYTVQVNGRTLTTRGIVIAAGGRPFAPSIPGLEEVGYLTSDTVWELRRLPARLAVLGGGPIGCELAQAFARFGSRVTQIGPRLLPREDPEIGAMIKERFESEGVDVRLGHKAAECRVVNGQKTLICKREENGEEVAIEFDAVLVA